MMAITIMGKVLGILRDSFQGTTFGADTAYGMAFAQASALPRNFLDIMFAAAFSASFIPVFTTYLETKGKDAAFDLAGRFISIVLVLTTLVVVAGILLATPIMSLTLSGDNVTPETITLGASLLRFMFPLMILSGLAFSFTGVLQSLGEFRIPAAMSLVSNAIILVYYLFFVDYFGVYGLAIVFLIGWGAQAGIQLPFLIKHKFKFKFAFNLRHPGIVQIGKLALPVLVSSWVVPINIMVNVNAASNLYGGEFGIVATYFSNSLFAIISGVFILSVSNVVFPKLSKLVALGDDAGFSHTLASTIRVVLLLLLPLTFGMFALSQPIVQLIYGRGNFCETAVNITSTSLMYLAPGIVGFGLFAVLSRACYARLDGRTPILASVVAIATNGVLSFALAPTMYIAGPALASAIAQTLGALVLVVTLTTKGVLKWHGAIDIAKMLFCAIIMFIVVQLVVNNLQNHHVIIQLGITATIGAAVYFALAYLLKIKEVKIW